MRAGGRMPVRPSYKICPGDRVEVEVVQPVGGWSADDQTPPALRTKR